MKEEVEFIKIDCCVCYMPFMVTLRFNQDRRKDQRTLWCPSGHGQSFVGETEQEKIQKELNAALSENKFLLSRVQDESARADSLQKTLNKQTEGVSGMPSPKRKSSAKSKSIITKSLPKSKKELKEFLKD